MFRSVIGTVALMAAVTATVGAQEHDTKYLWGGYGSTSSLYATGVWMSDAATQGISNLTPNHQIYYARSIRMDADNRNVVFAAEGTTSASYASFIRSGIYRVDPATLALSTIYHSTVATYSPRHLILNQDGDYVFNNYRQVPSTSYDMMKVDVSGNVATILSSATTNNANLLGLGINMDTGNYLVNLNKSGTFYYTVLDVAEDGTFTTFGGGNASGTYGWYGYYSKIVQNHDTGDIEGHYQRNLYQLKAGNASRTTLWQLGIGGGLTLRYGSLADNQSAANPRFVASGYTTKLINGLTTRTHTIFYIDRKPPYAVTATECDPSNTNGFRYNYAYGFDFYRGRHVQSIKMGPQQWAVSISCPRFAGKPYVAALSLSGYRPALRISGGRKIHLVPDGFTVPSIANQLKPYFDAGPGVLDARGMAAASIDLSRLGKLNTPLWISVIVLDPQAPGGIAYIPDTYVMRV